MGQYLGIKATHFDGQLTGIALALEGHKEADMVALLSDCKPAIRVVEKIDSGRLAPRTSIEARIQQALGNRREKDTYLACQRT